MRKPEGNGRIRIPNNGWPDVPEGASRAGAVGMGGRTRGAFLYLIYLIYQDSGCEFLCRGAASNQRHGNGFRMFLSNS